MQKEAAKILIVEDEPAMAFILKKLITDMGYSVCASVVSGEESIIEAEKHMPDLVLMDINLEGEMDGIEAAEIILTKFGIPVIYATADGEEETVNSAKSTYPLGYILKPYNEKTLKSTLVIALSIREVEKRKNQELQAAYDTISYQTKELIDSFKSAKEIQSAILPTESGFKTHFPNSFILNMPKDNLGGDFFWYRVLANGNLLFGVIDCTGHGVPGALMSVLVNYQLDHTLKTLSYSDKIGDIFSQIDKVLSDYESENETPTTELINEISDLNSGFDAALCLYDFKTKKIRFCGAKRPLYLFRKGVLQEFRGSRSSVGLFSIAGKKFEETEIQLEENDQLFLFSDGYTDQIGGPRNKRFMSKRLKETIKELLSSSSSDQHKKLIETIIDWKGNNEEQLDDILVLGIKL